MGLPCTPRPPRLPLLVGPDPARAVAAVPVDPAGRARGDGESLRDRGFWGGNDPPLKILSCEDHDLLRDGLQQVLRALPDEPTLLEAATAAEALALLEAEGDVALVILDLGLPDIDGLDLLTELRRRFPATGVAVLSGSERPGDVQAALERGAQAYIPKSAGRAELLDALRRVLAGEVVVPAALRAAAESLAARALTPRQAEVAALLVRGLTNPEIARVLDLHVGTVKKNVESILEALEVSNRTEAVLALVERGIVPPARGGP